MVHAKCVNGGDSLPHQSASTVFEMRLGGGRSISGKIALQVSLHFIFHSSNIWFSEAVVRARLRGGCPACHKKEEGERI